MVRVILLVKPEQSLDQVRVLSWSWLITWDQGKTKTWNNWDQDKSKAFPRQHQITKMVTFISEDQYKTKTFTDQDKDKD